MWSRAGEVWGRSHLHLGQEGAQSMSVTATENENITLVQRGFEAFKAGDMATLINLFEADAEWHGPSLGILKADYAGRDAVLGMFGQLFQETGGTFKSGPKPSPRRAIASSSRAPLRASAKAGPSTLRTSSYSTFVTERSRRSGTTFASTPNRTSSGSNSRTLPHSLWQARRLFSATKVELRKR
jgi:hypothetical protein